MASTSNGFRAKIRIALCTLAVGVGLSAVADSARAALITQTRTLDQLLAGGVDDDGLLVGDKLYSSFTLSSSGDVTLDPEDIDVTISTADNVTYSIRFNFGLDAFPGETSDLTIGYRLDVVNSTDLIGRLGLSFNGSVPSAGAGNAAASISELVRTVDFSDLDPGPANNSSAVLTVFNDGTAGLPDNNSAFLTIIPKASLLFEKNILVSSRPTGGYVHVSVVDNLVEQVPASVPEPTALLSGALTLAGLVMLRRRK